MSELASEYGPDVLNTLCATAQNFIKNVRAH